MACAVGLTCCNDGWLDKKPDQKIAMLNSLSDLQALLDNNSIMNSNTPYLGELSSPYFYLESGALARLQSHDRNAYLWKTDVFEGYDPIIDWDWNFRKIFYTNVVLEEARRFDDGSVDYRNVMASAFFLRAWANFQLVQVFCPAYSEETAETALGLPLKISPVIDDVPDRSTLADSYGHIVADLRSCLNFEINYRDPIKARPSVAAAYALLAKTFLLMGDYSQALENARHALEITESRLIDYNAVDLEANFPFELFNEEVIFQASISPVSALRPSRLLVDTVFYNSYGRDDLRKKAYYFHNTGGIAYKGSYCGSDDFFSGISVNELYLIASECYIRLGELEKGKEMLRALLDKRLKTDDAQIDSLTDAADLLGYVLTQRQKELVFRGILWGDLKRLNREPEFARTLIRGDGTDIYELPPNDKRYVMPLPDKVVRLSGLVQNER